MSYFSDYVTHCIVGEDPVDTDITDANELYEVPAVSQQWVSYSAKCKKLLPYPFFRLERCVTTISGPVNKVTRVRDVSGSVLQRANSDSVRARPNLTGPVL